jgi:hypothetical protein
MTAGKLGLGQPVETPIHKLRHVSRILYIAFVIEVWHNKLVSLDGGLLLRDFAPVKETVQAVNCLEDGRLESLRVFFRKLLDGTIQDAINDMRDVLIASARTFRVSRCESY